MKASKAQLRAQAKYDKEYTKGLYLKFNTKNDADILQYLDAQNNKQGLVKSLIREHMKKAGK
jgi:hypothetical protein